MACLQLALDRIGASRNPPQNAAKAAPLSSSPARIFVKNSIGERNAKPLAISTSKILSAWRLSAGKSDDKHSSSHDGEHRHDAHGHGHGKKEHQSSTPKVSVAQRSDEKQEVDWKKDEDFKKFMSNPSIESALKLERKRVEQKLEELNSQEGGNFFSNLLRNAKRSSFEREKNRLERAEGKFRALDLSKLRSCFGYDTFFVTDARRFGDGGIFIGNLRDSVENVIPVLKDKLSRTIGREVTVWFIEEGTSEEKQQVCVVQPKDEIDLQFELSSTNNLFGYFSAIFLFVTTVGTCAITSGFFLVPNPTFDDYINRVLPLFGGFVAILGVSEVATRYTARKYGVRLSPSFLIPSTWTGCLGVVNNYESLLPSKKALFDIAATRATSAFITSFVLAATAFYLDQSWNGGSNALYVRPAFFYNNPMLSFIQYVIGPYSDELGNVMPQAVEGLGVPVDPLAFAGLLGIVVTSLNLLPCGRLEGGRLVQALYGRRTASILSIFTSLAMGIGGLTGSVLSLTWAFFATFFRRGEELPAEDEISPLGTQRYILGWALAVFCVLALFPNSAGTFPSALYTPPFFRGDGF